jgi:COX assembly mitochondrial protein 1
MSSPSEKFHAKSDARSERLTVLRKNNEEVLRKQLKNEVIDECRESFQAFGRCAEKASIAVVFSCRNENQAMSDCMDKHWSEERFLEFAKQRGFEPAPKGPPLSTWLWNNIVGK